MARTTTSTARPRKFSFRQFEGQRFSRSLARQTGYAVFARVTKAMDVVIDKYARSRRPAARASDDVPVDAVIMRACDEPNTA